MALNFRSKNTSIYLNKIHDTNSNFVVSINYDGKQYDLCLEDFTIHKGVNKKNKTIYTLKFCLALYPWYEIELKKIIINDEVNDSACPCSSWQIKTRIDGDQMPPSVWNDIIMFTMLLDDCNDKSCLKALIFEKFDKIIDDVLANDAFKK
jgi:hypothetical protein